MCLFQANSMVSPSTPLKFAPNKPANFSNDPRAMTYLVYLDKDAQKTVPQWQSFFGQGNGPSEEPFRHVTFTV